MCMTVGKESLEDADMLTWSLGWTGFLLPILPPSISIARLEMTSLAFMFDWVPDPVGQTTTGTGAWDFAKAIVAVPQEVDRKVRWAVATMKRGENLDGLIDHLEACAGRRPAGLRVKVPVTCIEIYQGLVRQSNVWCKSKGIG